MPTVIGYKQLLSTDLKYFIGYKPIGEHLVFSHYPKIVQYLSELDPKYCHFISFPVLDTDSGSQKIDFYGTQKGWEDDYSAPIALSTLEESESKNKYQLLLEENLKYYQSIIDKNPKDDKSIFLSYAIEYINPNFVFCYNDKIVLGLWGMTLKEKLERPIDEIVIGIPERKDPDPGPIPPPTPPQLHMHQIIFDPQQEGYISSGPTSFQVEKNTTLHPKDIPSIEANSGFEFVCWKPNPNNHVVVDDQTFYAHYESTSPPLPPTPPAPPPKLPWWRRLWNWLKNLLFGKGCLKWLVRILLAILLLFLLSFLFRDCQGCNNLSHGGGALNDLDSTWLNQDPNRGSNGGIYDPNNPYQPIPTPPAYSDILPPSEGVMPPISENPDIIPGNPSILANRLNILLENEDKSVLDLARAFKNKYPDEKYKVVYYDNVIKRMQIEIPKEERERLKSSIPEQVSPEFEVFVFDEAMFEGNAIPTDPEVSNSNNGYYLKTIKAQQAWEITQGSPDITVAVVDNGFHLNHPELENKVVQPYNVWKHSSEITAQSVDHGTHVAGTAVARSNNGEGLCGIAPNCKLMPVQVADELGRMTTTSVLDGIIYALYQGADVVNVSLGCSFQGLDRYPREEQEKLINEHFKEEERLWREVMRIASKHNSTIVVAAGNDNVLAGIEPLQRPELFITVSAVDKSSGSRNKSSFSNYGEFSTVSAPGVGIYSCMGDDEYGQMDGTSMAAPIVTGAIALMKSLKPNLTNKQIKCILQSTGISCNGEIGNLIQLDKALQMVKSGNIPKCTPTPASGDIQVLLKWNNYNDLDLIVTDPNGDAVWYKNPRVSSGGQLQIDMNVEYPDNDQPFENIYWPAQSAQSGTYNVYVLDFKNHQGGIQNNYTVDIKNGEKQKSFSGTANEQGKAIHICSFSMNGINDVANANSSNSNQRIALEDQKKKLQKELDRINEELERIN